MLVVWAKRVERGTKQESGLGVYGEEGGLGAERGGSGGGLRVLGAWAKRDERGTSQESRLWVCGEEGGLRAERGGSGGGCECSERGQGGTREGQSKNQGLGCAVRKVVSGPRGEIWGWVVSAQSMGKKGREGDNARIRAWDVR